MLNLVLSTWVFAGWDIDTRRFGSALLLTLAFTAVARWLRGVSVSGSIAGAVICFLLYSAAGLGAFAALVSVFVLTWVATQFGYQRKQTLGTAENRRGRTGSQVLANLATATGFAVFSAFSQKAVFLAASVAALSEAAADTVSSEFGQALGDTARLITTGEVVPAGTNGGVSLIGTASGILAAAMVGGISSLAGLVSLKGAVYCTVAGALGMTADSYLGAFLERPNLLDNNWVNFLSTLVAAGVALLLA
ncbi:MAG TPA: DUF92 domain-containing protein [Terriglobales bacterium]|nr:DUF92 domain-containing protein [Terriglobales bacterium]